MQIISRICDLPRRVHTQDEGGLSLLLDPL